MSRRIMLLSKDAMGKFYLPIYGNTIWHTPNIDELAEKGTIFDRHYTAAPSSNMSYFSTFARKYSHETEIPTYLAFDPCVEETVFDLAEKRGYRSHIVWDSSWYDDVKHLSSCYGKNTIFHNIDGIKQSVGPHSAGNESLRYDERKVKQTLSAIEKEIEAICQSDDDVFVWMHMPHVLNGYTGYGSDIEAFDSLVGVVRKYFSDDCIYITADHGNMNGLRGKLGYGFDVYENASCIPLIAPRVEGRSRIDFPTSNTNLYELIFEHRVVRNEFVYSDSAYYAQLHRKLAIVHGRYKYIYNAEGGKEELYDVVFDPNETQNLIDDYQFDVDRGLKTLLCHMYYYPNWDQVALERTILRNEKNRIWRKPNTFEYLHGVYEKYGKKFKRRYNKLKKQIRLKIANDAV